MDTVAPAAAESIPNSRFPGPYPVGSYAAQLRRRLQEFARVQLVGEVWGVRESRVRVYFELRDARGALPCSMWREEFDRLGVTLADGMRIVVGGGCDYYPGSSASSPTFSFTVTELRLAGEGDLLVALERLRRKLHAEGLFEPQKRLPLAPLPKTIGVVTGEGGKARDDVLAGLRRRGWSGRLVWAFVPVQDRQAAPRIAAALRELAATPEVEVVIVARGGGSSWQTCTRSAMRRCAGRSRCCASPSSRRWATTPTGRSLMTSRPCPARPPRTPPRRRSPWTAAPPRAGRLSQAAARLRDHGRRAIVMRARALVQLSPVRRPSTWPATAGACTSCCGRCAPRRAARPRAGVSPRLARRPPWSRTAARAADGDRARRARDLDQLALALAAHDPQRARWRAGTRSCRIDAGTPLASAGGRLAERGSFDPALPRRSRRRRGRRRGGDRMNETRTYESAVARVEEIIRRLDSGEAGLRETLELVREGRELVEYCAGELDAVSQGLEELRLEELCGAPGPDPARPAGRPMSTFSALADLPLQVDRYTLEGLRQQVSSGFERLSTVVHLHGDGAEGVGVDVVYEAEDQVALQEAGPVLALAGRYALGEFCELVNGLDLFPVEPQRGEVSRLYRRWTFHSAALDLALRQAGRPLHAALGRAPQPLTFVVSLRLGEPPTLEPIESRLAHYPTLRFKLDATTSWTPDLIAALARSGAVDSIDFKALYHGTIVDQEPDPVLYERVVAAFPEAWLEDPDVVTAGTAAALAAAHDRITWDAPIHSIADIEALPFPPRMVNIKPSRIGGLKKLCDTYDYCAEHGIGAYGGGQFELGVGRGQAQYLASLFHADTPNDLAPVGFNQNDPPPGRPSSPLPVAADEVGYRWG